MRVLHITNWYSSKPTPNAAPWIKAQIDSIGNEVHNTVYHVEVRKGALNILRGDNEDGSFYLILVLPIMIWRLIELLSLQMVKWVLSREKGKYDLINFHIAYPNLTYFNRLKKRINTPVLISEHWSAYHYNFNVKERRKLGRIKQIFRHGVPVAAVSKSLINDIQRFSTANFDYEVIPNVVDTNNFYFDPSSVRSSSIFFMVSLWKSPKDPFSVINTWQKLMQDYPDAILRVGGYGPQWDEMIRTSDCSNIEFIGKLSPNEVALEMRKAAAFIHCSDYETFSVVCAEALCCGTPVIASKVGGIEENVDEDNGLLFSVNNADTIYSTIDRFHGKKYKHEQISKDALAKFSRDQVSKVYSNLIRSIVQTH